MRSDSSHNIPRFSDLPLNEPILNAVQAMGFARPTEVQSRVIPLALTGQDLLVSAETGSGKTAAFLVPMIQRLLTPAFGKHGTRCLILTPTRELARQIYKTCLTITEPTELKTALIVGGDNFKNQLTNLKKQSDIVIATPGRLLELLNQEITELNGLEVLILDEADRMLDMGFSEDVQAIANCCSDQRQTMLFSATLTHSGIVKMADRVSNDYEIIALNSLHDDHRNIEQQIILADDNEHKQQLLTWLLQNENYGKCLIFANSRIQAEVLCGPLRGQKLRAGVLHGEIDQKERKRIVKLFRDGTIDILIASDLAARGLDIDGIDLVINFDTPRNGINYIHRTGRTGRADQKGLAITLVKHDEWNVISGIERFLHRQFTRRTIEALIGKYRGPKKIKSSGKAAGSKKRNEHKKNSAEKVKIRHRDKKNIGKRRIPTGTGPVK